MVVEILITYAMHAIVLLQTSPGTINHLKQLSMIENGLNPSNHDNKQVFDPFKTRKKLPLQVYRTNNSNINKLSCVPVRNMLVGWSVSIFLCKTKVNDVDLHANATEGTGCTVSDWMIWIQCKHPRIDHPKASLKPYLICTPP